MKEEKTKKKRPLALRIIGGFFKTVICLILAAVLVAANTVLPTYSRMVNEILGYRQAYNNPAEASSLDLEYNKADFAKEEMKEEGQALNEEIVGEGTVLLVNDGVLPYEAGHAFSFFSQSSVSILAGGYSGGGVNVKDAFESKGFTVNTALWEFYQKSAKNHQRGPGSISYGRDEDFSIGECPAEEIAAVGLEDSFAGTTGVFVWSRVVGEGRDMPRSMYNHTEIPEDQVKSYLEPDSVELSVLQYMDERFDDIVILVNSPAAMELGWINDFEHIHAVVAMGLPGTYGMNAVADIFAGNINPSGRTVDTYAYDAFSSPAAQNYGDYMYVDESGALTKYSYLSYAEGIYVGYKYYETRYEDAVLGQGNAGDYDYDRTVQFPFGYGLSYTTFSWDGLQVQWNGDTAEVQVHVTNTGSVAGKDVVEIYAQSPYTDYDKANGIEKASVQLVGYAKTQLLEPGAEETLKVTFDREQLKAYDAEGAGTYIFDAGEYYITAGRDAHDAMNNILAAKGAAVTGDAQMVSLYVPENTDTDTTTYAADSYSGTAITNQFGSARGEFVQLTRQDWTGTFPAHDGEVSGFVSTWGNEINGTDENGNPASLVYVKTATADMLAQMDSTDSLNPVDDASITDVPVFGADNGLSLIELRGLDYDDEKWEQLLDQLKVEDYDLLVNYSGYGTPAIESVQKPHSLDADSATGLVFASTGGLTFNGAEVLAQTYNVDLARRFGNFIGNDGLLGGVTGWYCPAMNIHRTPFSGRNNEYYSEDAFVSGLVASESMRAASEKGMYTFIKHFALNDQENHRGDTETEYGACTFASEQAIREIYLKPFEMCMKMPAIEERYLKADGNGSYTVETRELRACQAMMTAFNRLGYTWTGGNYPLITGIVRNEWAFNGFIITDAETPTHMDPLQMIKAGADGKLNYATHYELDFTQPAVYHYARSAAHHILFTVANAKIMNGSMPGSTLTGGPITDTLRIVLTVVPAALLLLIIGLTIRGRRK